jgi:hypothetical protein
LNAVTVKKWIVRLLFACAIACAISLLILNDYYARSRPRKPSSVIGQIHAHVAGGALFPKATVYLTSNEFAAFYIFLAMSIVPALAAAAINADSKVR